MEPEETTEPVPTTEPYELKRHYAVSFGGDRKLVPIRKNKVTTKLMESCKPGIATWRDAAIRFYVCADEALCKKLSPYIDSKLTTRPR